MLNLFFVFATLHIMKIFFILLNLYKLFFQISYVVAFNHFSESNIIINIICEIHCFTNYLQTYERKLRIHLNLIFEIFLLTLRIFVTIRISLMHYPQNT